MVFPPPLLLPPPPPLLLLLLLLLLLPPPPLLLMLQLRLGPLCSKIGTSSTKGVRCNSCCCKQRGRGKTNEGCVVLLAGRGVEGKLRSEK